MSVTFYVNNLDITEYEITCACSATKSDITYSSFEDAYAATQDRSVASVFCGDDHCGVYSNSVNAVTDAPEINISNANAAHILDTLGISVGYDWEHRCVGTIAAEDILGRALVALAVNPSDGGVPATTEGIVIDCGRSEGYTERIMVEIEAIAEYAKAHNKSVAWS